MNLPFVNLPRTAFKSLKAKRVDRYQDLTHQYARFYKMAFILENTQIHYEKRLIWWVFLRLSSCLSTHGIFSSFHYSVFAVHPGQGRKYHCPKRSSYQSRRVRDVYTAVSNCHGHRAWLLRWFARKIDISFTRWSSLIRVSYSLGLLSITIPVYEPVLMTTSSYIKLTRPVLETASRSRWIARSFVILKIVVHEIPDIFPPEDRPTFVCNVFYFLLVLVTTNKLTKIAPHPWRNSGIG